MRAPFGLFRSMGLTAHCVYCAEDHTRVVPTSNPSPKIPPHSDPPQSSFKPRSEFSGMTTLPLLLIRAEVKMRTRIFSISIIALLLFTVGCNRPPRTPEAAPRKAAWTPLEKVEMSPQLKAQLERSMLAIRDLGSGLLKELSEGLDAEGPSGGIEICRQKAPEIAMAVSHRYHLKIGRSSVKLRNPKNRAPEWARSSITNGEAVARYFRGPGGELGVLAPIRLKSQCLMCHGGEEDIDDSVRAALAEHYPDDQATGFAEGDLRGWFWVEVPPAASSPGEEKSPAE